MSTVVGAAVIEVGADVNPFTEALDRLREIIDSFPSNLQITADTTAATQSIRELREQAQGIELGVGQGDQAREIENQASSVRNLTLATTAAAGANLKAAAAATTLATAQARKITTTVASTTANTAQVASSGRVSAALSKEADTFRKASVAIKKVQLSSEGLGISGSQALGAFGQRLEQTGNRLQSWADISSRVEQRVTQFKGSVLGAGQAIKGQFANAVKGAKDGLISLRKGFGALVAKVGGWKRVAIGAASLLTALVIKMSSVADEIDNLANQTGLTIATIQSLSRAAEDGGVKFDALQAAVTRLTNEQEQAINGNERSIKSFSALGISLEELRRASPEQLLERVSVQLSRNRGNTAALAASTELLGRNSVRLRNILTDLGESGLGEFNDKMRDSNRIIRDETVVSLDLFNQELETLKSQIRVASAELAGKLVSAFRIYKVVATEAVQIVREFIPAIDLVVKGVLGFVKIFSVGLQVIGRSLLRVLELIPRLRDSVARVREELDQVNVEFRARWNERAQDQMLRAAQAAAAEAEIAATEAAAEAARNSQRELEAGINQLTDAAAEYEDRLKRAQERMERSLAIQREALALRRTELGVVNDQVKEHQAIQESIRNSLSLLSGASAIQRAFQENAFRSIDPATDKRLGQQIDPFDLLDKLSESIRGALTPTALEGGIDALIPALQEQVRAAEENVANQSRQLDNQKEQIKEARTQSQKLEEIKRGLLQPILN